MPLSPPAARRPIHKRQIEVNGYQRDDGLWDIEGRVLDTKSYRFEEHERVVPAGDAQHDLWLRLTLTGDGTIRAAEASTDAAPFTMCGDIAPAFGQLVGLNIGKGFQRAVREKLGGSRGCTHLVELLVPMATVAFQTMGLGPDPDRRQSGMKVYDPDQGGPHLGGCHTFAFHSETVRRHYPKFFREKG